MGIIEISEQIGIELRNTFQGQTAYTTYLAMTSSLSGDEMDLLSHIRRHIVWSANFYGGDSCKIILTAKKDVPEIKAIANSILSNSYFNEWVASAKILGIFTEQTSKSMFHLNIPYQLPGGISATPKLIRLCQELSVQCQKLQLLRQLLNARNKPDIFAPLVKSFDEACAPQHRYPYGKFDRKVIKRLICQGFDEADIYAIYNSIMVLDMVKQAIFESFIGSIFEMKASDIISKRQRNYKDIQVAHMVLPDAFLIMLQGCKNYFKVLEEGKTTYGLLRSYKIYLDRISAGVYMRTFLFPCF